MNLSLLFNLLKFIEQEQLSKDYLNHIDIATIYKGFNNINQETIDSHIEYLQLLNFLEPLNNLTKLGIAALLDPKPSLEKFASLVQQAALLGNLSDQLYSIEEKLDSVLTDQ